MSIIAIVIMILVSLGSVLAFTLEDDEYQETTVIENLTYNNEREYVLKDTEAMIAFQFVWKDAEAEKEDLNKAKVDQYLRYFFVDTNKQGNETKITVYPAILCTEKYSNRD